MVYRLLGRSGGLWNLSVAAGSTKGVGGPESSRELNRLYLHRAGFSGVRLFANVVGCLCTPLDRLADKAHLPRAEVGDLIAVFCAGAYGASASPSAFLGQGPAIEMLV